MRAGKLDRIITIESPVVAQDATFGGADKVWCVVASVWAELLPPKKATEIVAGAVEGLHVELAFRIRYRADVTEECRVLYQGRYYTIWSLSEIGRRRSLEILCKRPS